jgi:signal transduction histidine kinase
VLDPEPASLGEVAREAWAHVDTAAMRLSVADEPTVLIDESRVTEVFSNLFRNAREHAGTDAAVRVGALDDGFYVADDGPGIPEQDRERVLESGFTTSKEGTGFGLSIVGQIADAHDWDVTVTESDGGGARFEFRNVAFAPDADTQPTI